jgi:alpha-1,2-mannosyltransferase
MEAFLFRSQRSILAQRLFLFVLLCFFIALNVQYVIKASANRSAIARWRNQIQHVEDEDIYLKYNYPNPPIMALLLEPIAALPPLAGSLLWFYLKIGMAVAALLWAFHMIETPDEPFPLWAKGLIILLSLRPIMGDLLHGNVNIFILFLVIGGLYAFQRKRDYVAGISIALAIACKVTPALFIPYFVWKRAWKTLAGIAVGLALFLIVIPPLRIGWEKNLQDLHSWTDQMVKPFVVEGEVTSIHPNQSLPGVLYRLVTASPSFLEYVNDQPTPSRYDNVLALDRSTVKWILKGCMLAFALLVVWRCRTPLAPREGWRLPAEFSLVLLGMLLFSERTWKHHHVMLLLPFAVLTYHAAVCQPGRARLAYLIGTLAAVALLMASTSTTFITHFDAKLAQVYGAYCLANLLLVAALTTILRRPAPCDSEVLER